VITIAGVPKESAYQAKLIKKLKIYFPGCYILKNDPNYISGIPDLTILYNESWATLEVKRSEKSPKRPNQEFHVNRMKEMSFSAFIFPENEKEVLYELRKYFGQCPEYPRLSRSEQLRLVELQRGEIDSDLEEQAGCA
jgi:hypothetical protein